MRFASQHRSVSIQTGIQLGVHADITTSGYRKELMHANSVRAGHLDLDGCTVVDMLPR